MTPTTKGILWALAAVMIGSWLPLFYVLSHISGDPFAWRSWLLVFQVAMLIPVFFVVPAADRRWGVKTRQLFSYWDTDGQPAQARTPGEIARTPALWMVICFVLDLACWVWAATLIDPLVVTIIFQLVLIGIVWLAARLGRKLSRGEYPSPHVMTGRHWVLMMLALSGAAMVIWSETGAVGKLNVLGIAVSLVGTLTAIGSLWGTVSTGRLLAWPADNAHDLVWNATFAAVAGRLLALPPTIVASIMFFDSSGNSFRLTGEVVVLLGVIGIFNALGALSHRYSLYVTPSLGVQRIMYLSPALQMLWLWMFANVSIANPPVLLLGSLVVLASTLGWQAQELSH